VLWERSLSRSQRRRERAQRARRNAPRQKGATLAAGAAILASPVMAPLASAQSSHPGVSKAEVAARAAVPRSTPTDLLSYGDTGEAVAAVQAQLRIPDDGIFGPQTEGAVKQFQIAHGLAATGVVDTRTWAELFRTQVRYFDEGSSQAKTVMASAGTAPSSSSGSSGGPDLSDRVELRDEVESSTPSTGSEPAPAPAPVASTPVSTGSGGCTSDGRIVGPVASGTVTSPYGDDRGDHIHSGEDIAAPTGTTVRAADCGTVSISGTESGYGEMVCIQHAGGTTTCYAHLSQRDVAVNDYVKAGQKIGEVGCTGNCTGPHVHFEVRLNGKATDPAPYLSGAKTVQGQSVPATTAALPAGQGGVGGPSAADETAVFGDATGGTTAPAQSSQPAAQIASQPAAQPAAQPASQPTAETAPPPVAETAPAPAPAQPAAETAPQPAAETAPAPAAETAPQPAAETAPQPAAETAPQPPADTAPPAAAPPAPQPPAETAPPAAAPPAPQPAAEASVQASAEPAPAQPADQAPAPAADPSVPAVEAPAPAPAATAAAPAADASASADAAASGGTAAPATAGQ
jgi:Meckel syndrome type 1 protein